MTLPRAVQQKLDGLPAAPGVYLFLGDGDETLYVGKAANLRSRVRSYFQAGTGDQRYFIERLQDELRDIETLLAGSEKEAALLENSLIKERHPRYNVKLRDDKEYLSLRLDPRRPWPRLEVVRRPSKDGARYFGPFHSATAARSTLRLVNRHFQLRTCTDSELKSRTRPCLQYQIKRCPGPCVLPVSEPGYDQQVRNVGMFLDGRHDELLVTLKDNMEQSAATQDYEVAAIYRDQVRAVESTQQSQRVSVVSDIDQDVFGYFRQEEKAEVAVLIARRGRVVGMRSYALKDTRLPDDELISSFLTEYYGPGSFVPHEILIPTPIEASDGLADLLSEQRGSRVELLRPQRGTKAQLLRMAMENAAHAFQEKARASEGITSRLKEVQLKLALPRLPKHIECIDISHTGGEDTVAAVVCFRDGQPDSKGYRSFHVKNIRGGDDYGAIHQTLLRRFKRGKEQQKGWALPDLLLVDGGKGQLRMAIKALEEVGIEDLPVAALAKEKENSLGELVVDRVYLPGRMNAIELRDNYGPLRMLAHARDEAHRFSNSIRLKLGKRRRIRSSLDDVKGVGPKTRTVLLKHFGSTSAVTEATADALVNAGATRKQAEAIHHHFIGNAGDTEASEQEAVDNAFLEPSSDKA